MSPRDRCALIPQKTSTNGNTEIEIITSEGDFGDLCTEWDDLWRRSPGAGVFQTFSCCLYTWKYIAKPAKRKLFCIVARENGAAVFIWPLVKYRKAVWSVIRPLGPSAVEYTQPLAEATDKADYYAVIAWQLLCTTCQADIINLPFTNMDSHLYRITARHSACNVETDFAPHVKWQGEETWDDYYNCLSKGYRRVQNKKRRQLSEIGEVCFEIVDDKSQFECLVSWLVEQKRKWGARVNKGSWSNNYIRYLASLATDEHKVVPIVVYVLRLNGRIIAAQLAAVCDTHIEWMIAGFDADFRRLSPGVILNEFCLRWAFDRKLNCYLGIGREENKGFWSKGLAYEIATLQVVNSRWGRVAYEAGRALRMAKARVNH